MRWAVLLLVLLLGDRAWAAPAFPSGVEEPLRVSIAVQVRRVASVEDSTGRFRATVALRLLWHDPRLAFQPEPGEPGRREYAQESARERLAAMWTPQIRIENMVGSLEAGLEEEGLVVDSSGEAQWFRLFSGEFAADLAHQNFPFDRQRLDLRFVSSQETLRRVVLVCDAKCRDFSGLVAQEAAGWRLGHFRVRSGSAPDWSGLHHARYTVEVLAQRSPEPYVATLFMPLFATMGVPLVALWLNRWDGRRLAIEAFELMNLSVAGLFATIALNLAVFSAQPFLVGTSNLVTRLFTLNYLLLGLAMLAILTFFRNQTTERPWSDPYVSRELHLALCWAVPLATVVIVVALFWSSIA